MARTLGIHVWRGTGNKRYLTDSAPEVGHFRATRRGQLGTAVVGGPRLHNPTRVDRRVGVSSRLDLAVARAGPTKRWWLRGAVCPLVVLSGLVGLVGVVVFGEWLASCGGWFSAGALVVVAGA